MNKIKFLFAGIALISTSTLMAYDIKTDKQIDLSKLNKEITKTQDDLREQAKINIKILMEKTLKDIDKELDVEIHKAKEC